MMLPNDGRRTAPSPWTAGLCVLSLAYACLLAGGCISRMQEMQDHAESGEELAQVRRAASAVARARLEAASVRAEARAREAVYGQFLAHFRRGQQAEHRVRDACHAKLGALRQSLRLDAPREVDALGVYTATPAETRHAYKRLADGQRAPELTAWAATHAAQVDLQVDSYNERNVATADADAGMRKRLLTIDIDGVDLSTLRAFLARAADDEAPVVITDIRVRSDEDATTAATVEVMTYEVVDE